MTAPAQGVCSLAVGLTALAVLSGVSPLAGSILRAVLPRHYCCNSALYKYAHLKVQRGRAKVDHFPLFCTLLCFPPFWNFPWDSKYINGQTPGMEYGLGVGRLELKSATNLLFDLGKDTAFPNPSSQKDWTVP